MRCQTRNLKDAPDHEHLWAATQARAILLTHDTGFREWHRAWLFWGAAWGVRIEHHGILIVPIESIWRPVQAALEIDACVAGALTLRNRCFLSSSSMQWQRV